MAQETLTITPAPELDTEAPLDVQLEAAAKRLRWARRTANAVKKTDKAASALLKEHLTVGEVAFGWKLIRPETTVVDEEAMPEAERQAYLDALKMVAYAKGRYGTKVPANHTKLIESKD